MVVKDSVFHFNANMFFIFILIQTCFSFPSFTALPEFEGVCVRHVVILALAVTCHDIAVFGVARDLTCVFIAILAHDFS